MDSIRRESNRRLNKKKIIVLTTLLLIVTICAIYLIIIVNKDNSNINENTEDIAEQEVVEEKTIEKIVEDFGGTIVEKIKSDTYYVKKDDKEYTIYEDGEIVEGRVVLWDGSSSKPAIDEAGNINIYNPAELRWIAEQVSSGERSFAGVTINLRAPLDFGARKNSDGVWEGNKWTPIIGFLEENNAETNSIDNNEVEASEDAKITEEYLKRFAGVFIGNNLSIRGIYVDTDTRYSGLFGYQTGTITGLVLKNSYISGTESVGALVGLNGGYLQNISIQNVEVVGTEKVGGVVGTTMSSSNIEECRTEGNKGLVIGDKYVGGIVGYTNNNATINKSSNNFDVSGSSYIGGIAGISFFGSTVSNSTNYANKIAGTEYVGGLIGYSQSQIENSSNQSSGNVSAKSYVGGIVGANYIMGNVTNCYNNSKVVCSKDNAGGIVGINNANISNCYNTGTIDAMEATGAKIGGVCGQNISESYVFTSYNIGKINAKVVHGGVIGANFGTTTNCFYLNSISNKVDNTEESKTDEEMKSSILESLGEYYKVDSENKNSGYPILTWQ